MENGFVLVSPNEAQDEDGQQDVTAGAAFDLQQLTPGDLGHLRLKLAKKGKYIQVYALIMEINTGVTLHPSKTLGIITSKHSPTTVLMSAQSGWSTGPQRDDLCLDTNEYNGLALNHLAAQLNFHFPGNQRDNGSQRPLDEHRGRAHAGHVEVLLATWYAIHVARRSLGLVDETNVDVVKRLKELKDQQLGNRRIAFINIDSEPCRTCLQFLNKLSQHTHLIFHVSGSNGIGPIVVRVDGGRRDDHVEDVFPDSDDENGVTPPVQTTPPPEPKPQDLSEAPNHSPEPTSSVTSTARFMPRRAQESWPKRRPAEWKAPNEDLVSRYKKGSPVLSWPRYPSVTPPAPPVPPLPSENKSVERTKKDPIYMIIDSDSEDEYEMVTQYDTPKTEDDIDPSLTESYFFVGPEETDRQTVTRQADDEHTVTASPGTSSSAEIYSAPDWRNQALANRRQGAEERDTSQAREARQLASATDQAPLPPADTSSQDMSDQFARSAFEVVRARSSHRSSHNSPPVTSPSAEAQRRLDQRRHNRRVPMPLRRPRQSIFATVPETTHDLDRFRYPVSDNRGERSILAQRFSILERPEYTGSEL
ncbi:hypothetical protein F5Y18DRAFT_337952 [Xylariaceae sp. FL1019]|nr:hypothetical protein F5Y18DRAFT_337952 [Xylariaceae sp. FL1019]